MQSRTVPSSNREAGGVIVVADANAPVLLLLPFAFAITPMDGLGQFHVHILRPDGIDNSETTRTVDCKAAKRHLSNNDGRSSHAATVSATVMIKHGKPRIKFGYLPAMLCLLAG